MTAMNVVHMRLKPGQEDEFVRIHKDMDARTMPGVRNFWLGGVKSEVQRFWQ